MTATSALTASGRTRALLLLASGAGISALGSQVSWIGLTSKLQGVGVYAVSGLFIAATAGNVVGAPVAGLLADRYRNRPLLIIAMAVQGLLLLSLLVTFSPALTWVTVALVGMSGCVVGTTTAALVPHITGEEDSMRGYSWHGTAMTVGSLGGVVLGGVLASTVGVQWALLIDGLTSLLQAGLMAAIRADRVPRRDRKTETDGRRDGLSHVLGDIRLGTRLLAQFFVVCATTVAFLGEIFLITDVMHATAFWYGLMVGCWGCGALLGSTQARRLRDDRLRAVAYVAGVTGLTVALFTPVAWPFLLANGLGWFAGGACRSLSNVLTNVFVQAHTPDEYRGRVFAAADSVTVAANLVGTAAGGALVVAIGPRGSLAAATAACAVAAIVAFSAHVVIRRSGDT
ncbi:MFS transporter [Kutzneria sp. 744]|uniref:MFS transporter n=1 Tax=Kutzneria sp. (strain 744) TaxID=345341 RepID=UPI0003EEB80F|nr:MFS transporter [Kutzneria sp. 744]EWM13742.1 major facilitator superfamily transporter [Kutzneria sp. 744]